MYGTIENVKSIELNEVNKIELKSDTVQLTLESTKYNTDELAAELMGGLMDCLYKYYIKQGFTLDQAERKMMDAIEQELCDNYTSSEIITG